MKKCFFVKELQKIEKDKLDEKRTTYKAILEDESEQDRIVLTSEKMIPLSKKDEVLIQKVKFQKKITEK